MLPSLVLAASIVGWTAATPLDAADRLARRATSVCSGNTASTRSEWCDYSIDTDYYEEAPDTGVTREYWVSDQQLHVLFERGPLDSC